MLTANQCRAARALLDISQSELARLAGVSLSTVSDFETGWRAARGRAKVSDEMATRLRAALENAGVELIDENGGGVGVRLRKRDRGRRS